MKWYFYPCCHGSLCRKTTSLNVLAVGETAGLTGLSCVYAPENQLTDVGEQLTPLPSSTPLALHLDPRPQVDGCRLCSALAGSGVGGLGQHKTFSPLATIYPRFIDNLCAHTHTDTLDSFLAKDTLSWGQLCHSHSNQCFQRDFSVSESPRKVPFWNLVSMKVLG